MPRKMPPPTERNCGSCTAPFMATFYSTGTRGIQQKRFCSLACKQRNNAPFKHGQARREKITSEHSIWRSMLSRCVAGTYSAEHYGNRGIVVCERWRCSFANFIADMGPRPSGKHSVDRIDNNGNYEPLNCRWATLHEQARNRRNNTVIEFRGQARTLIEWSEITGIKFSTLSSRIHAKKWSIDRALTTVPAR